MLPRDESGSTALEALIAIAVIAVAGAALVAGTRLGLSSSVASGQAGTAAAGILRFDDALRSAALRVRIPYWSTALRIEPDQTGCAVPWVDGNPSRYLTLAASSDFLELSIDGETRRFSSVLDAKFRIISRDGNVPAGLRVDYTIGGRKLTCVARFGAAAIVMTAKP